MLIVTHDIPFSEGFLAISEAIKFLPPPHTHSLSHLALAQRTNGAATQNLWSFLHSLLPLQDFMSFSPEIGN